MKTGDKVGLVGLLVSVGVAFLVLMNTSNGRMAQGGVLLQLFSTVMFLYAGIHGSRWWFAAPLGVVLFWVGAAHVGGLWN
jgi:hypothetical protein